MKRCPKCLKLNPPSALHCDCGKEFPNLYAQSGKPAKPHTVDPEYNAHSISDMEDWHGNAVSDFFSFRAMWTPTLLKILFVLGLLGILGFGGYRIYHAKGPAIGLAIAATIGAVILWRLLCEAWILFFSIHERLHEIRKELLEVQSVIWRSKK